MLNCASLSGRQGELMIFTTRFSPRPFLNHSRVVVACAMMLPPMGFTPGPANMLAPSRLACTTWFVTTMATPNSSARRCSCRRYRPRFTWRSESSPRPLYSVLYREVALSTTMRAKRFEAIMAAASMSSLFWCSVLWTRAYATLSRTFSGSSPWASAICTSLWGRKFPSVSMYMHLPSPPPCVASFWHVTARVWQNWVFPQRNSP
mmetsp:Transcript_25502/g.71484  ORF Transcript_25502/g.71484 Transcript_25502/m.71484 type:complete len:205 (+) Transcript_25502:81-695(+)